MSSFQTPDNISNTELLGRGLISPYIQNTNGYTINFLFPIQVMYKKLNREFIDSLKDIIIQNFYTSCDTVKDYFKDYHQSQWRNLKPVIEFCKGNDFVFQSRDDLYNLEEFKPTVDVILDAFKNYSDFCNMDIESCTINSMWYNIYKDKGENNRHGHPNSFASGVIVLQDRVTENPECQYSSFHFYNNSNTNQCILPRFKDNKTSIYFSEKNSLILKPGDLLMFPSFLHHSAHNTHAKNNNYDDMDENWRITLAFNIMLKGHAGHFGSYNYF